MKQLIILIFLSSFWSQASFGQADYLSIEEAIELAIEHNYNINVATNNKSIAENNTSKFNTGVLPTVSATAGAAYNYSRQTIKIDGVKNSARGHDFPFSAGVGINYVLFDKSRKVNIQQFNELYNLSDLQLRQSIENMLINLHVNYYQVTTLERNIEIQKSNLAISKRNLTRAEYAFEYGVATKLGILNNEVNVNNDSIQLKTSIVNFENAKRDLNIIIGRDPSVDFRTDTTINYVSDFTIDQLLNEAESNNILLLSAQQNITLEQLNLALAETNWWPKVSANGAYNWNQDFLVGPPANLNLQNFNGQINYTAGDGFNGGLNLSWSIFDGGKTKTQVQNAKISIENNNLYKDEVLRQIQRDIYNNWMSYENAIFVIETQQKNIETSQRNFERSAEQFKLGNISTTSFREAQNNLLNAQLSYLNALYNAKVLETTLLQLSGNLVGK